MARLSPQAGPTLGLHHHPSLTLGEAATQTFKRGAVVKDNGAGYVTEAGVNPADIVGIAMTDGQNGTNAGDKLTMICPAIPHAVVEMSLDQASSLGRVTAQTDLFQKYGITKDASGIWYIDVDKAGANARVVVVGFKDAVGTASGRVYAMWLNGSTIFA